MRIVKPKKSFVDICNNTKYEKYATPLGTGHLDILYQYGLMANMVDGVAAEAGVFSGASLFTLANVFDRTIHAFDTWQGLPSVLDKDGTGVREGDFSVDLEVVKERLSFTDKIVYHKGKFCDTFPLFDPDIKFAYVFCDIDLYQSCIECLEFFYPKLCSGGVLILDDYFCSNTPGIKIALDEMTDKYHITDIYSVRGLVVITRRLE